MSTLGDGRFGLIALLPGSQMWNKPITMNFFLLDALFPNVMRFVESAPGTAADYDFVGVDSGGYLVRTATAGVYRCIGRIIPKQSPTTPRRVLLQGPTPVSASYTPGAPLWISNTPGQVSTSIGPDSNPVGIVLGGGKMYLDGTMTSP